MAIFNCYVSSPEGIPIPIRVASPEGKVNLINKELKTSSLIHKKKQGIRVWAGSKNGWFPKVEWLLLNMDQK